MKVRLVDWGQSFATRERAVAIADEVAVDLERDGLLDSLVLDFAGVAVVSGSFADELVRRVLEVARQAGVPTVKFVMASDLVAARVKWALDLHWKVTPVRPGGSEPIATLVA